jgi:glycerol-3-phosphate dehydrogenase
MDSDAMESYNLLVIGGGINGTAIAAAAAARGLSVLLAEKGDLGGGTSAASSKLIHGGLRYLQYGEIGLVREALHDREALLRRRPHLVRPIELLIPVRAGGPVPPWKLELGLTLYDRLAGASRRPRHRRLSRAETLEREPDLEPAGLVGGFVYPDAQVLFPERLCIELAREAAEAGAVIRTHTEVVGLRREGARVVGAWLQDDRRQATGDRRQATDDRRQTTGKEAAVPIGLSPVACRLSPEDCEAISARLIVNAAGPWVDAVRRLTGEPLTPLLGCTKGSHLVMRWPTRGPRGPLYATARSDGRPFFILPWREMLLVGTTDIPYHGDPAEVLTDSAEVEYLLEEAAALFPRAPLMEEAVLYTYAGLRPLPARKGVPGRDPADRITRRHRVVDHAADGVPGLWSIVGGKLTTHRTLAEQVVDRAIAVLLGKPFHQRGGGRRSTAGGELDLAALSHSVAEAAADLPLEAAQIEHLVRLYGPRAREVVERVRRNPVLGERICAQNPDVAAQIEMAVEQEWALTLADLLLRRTGIGTSPCLGLDCAERAAAWMGRAAGWSDTRRTGEIAAYRQLVRRRYRAGLRTGG